MSANDFGTRPFVAGTLTGLRAFRVTPTGHLTGIFVADYELTPDVNLASCHSSRRWAFRIFNSYVPTTEDHELLSLKCRCGFYAYFDGGNDFLAEGLGAGDSDPRVAAIVEGYGKVVVGERGFRAEKLRLVALVRPPAEKPKRTWHLVKRWNAAALWMAYHPRGSAVAVALAGLLLMSIPLGLAPLSPWVAYPASFAVGWSWAYFMHRFHRYGWHLRIAGMLQRGLYPQRRELDWDQLLANYPDVPVYPSTGVALAAHPLTVPEKPEGEEPDPGIDADVWRHANPQITVQFGITAARYAKAMEAAADAMKKAAQAIEAAKPETPESGS